MMDKTTTGPPGVAKAQEYIERIIKHLSDVLIEIDEYAEELRELRDKFRDDPSDASDLIKKIREITKVVATSREYSEKAHEFVYERAGAAGEYAVDLDEARTEIGKCLDRIRLARGTDSVS